MLQKEDHRLKMEALRHRKEELERKEADLALALLKFDKFVKENDAR